MTRAEMWKTLQMLEAVAADTRLSDRSFRLFVHIVFAKPDDDGFVFFARDDMSRSLHGFPGKDSTAYAVRELVISQYVERRPGGRGNPDSYRVAESLRVGSSRLYNQLRVGSSRLYVSETDHLESAPADSKSRKEPSETVASPVAAARSRRTRRRVDADRDASRRAGTRVAEASARDDVVDEEDVITSFPQKLSTETIEDAIGQHAELLHGCRGALRDYCRKRVPAADQYAYVQTLAGWLDGTEPNLFGKLEPRAKVKLLASALNDLAASDEDRMKGAPGSIRNLRTKLAILLGKFPTTSNGHAPESRIPARTPANGKLEPVGTDPVDQWRKDNQAAWNLLLMNARAEIQKAPQWEGMPPTMLEKLAESRAHSLAKQSIGQEN